MSGVSGCHRTQSEKCTSGSDVSILVTEASPESAIIRPPLNRQNSESTVVQVLVHRESEEYNNEDTSPTQTEPDLSEEAFENSLNVSADGLVESVHAPLEMENAEAIVSPTDVVINIDNGNIAS